MASSTSDQGFQPAPAVGNVFATVELAEMIFLGLSMRDVLCGVQGTCREWSAVVDGSLPIQQALFRKPITSMRLRYDEYDGDGIDQWMNDGQPVPEAFIFEHPFMTLLFDETDKAFSIHTNHPTGSWTKCLIAQPAIAESKLKMSYIMAKREDLKDSEGLVIGALKLNERTWNAHDMISISGDTCWMSLKLTDELKEIRQRVLNQR
ncbi:hypothetical protein LTS10_011495 [Elasticomyces elasticus]|nr:hypothetical protein LTS10_011495 [Elasticomyces elasticus]